MSSAGIMASAVVAAGTDVLLENFTSVTDWTGGMTSVAGGRSGNAGQLTGSNVAAFTLGAANESATVAVGLAHKLSSIAVINTVLGLTSDTNATIHTTVAVNTSGALVVLRGSAGGFALYTSAAGLIAVNTWNYIELKATLHDTAGAIELRLNGTSLSGPMTGLDTKNAGTKAVYDTLRLTNSSGVTSLFDDLYLTVGASAAFKGDITVP